MSGVFSRRGSQPPKQPTPPPAPAAAEADPSMEDILASIRRILNEGETETAAAVVEAKNPEPVPEKVAQPQPAPVAEAPPPAPVETEKASTDPVESVEADDVFILEPDMMVSDTVEAAPIASTETAAAASQSMGALKKALSERHAQVYKATAISLEEIVREEVRPMLKDWLDTHLPAIVERLVRAEIERVVAREMM
jgi:cell pole-organizing protein PopZ